MPARAKLPAMNIPLRKPWTQEEFFAWAENQDTRYEFDGFQPIAMTGGTGGSSAIGVNLIAVLHRKLRGSPCRPLGPDAGVETVNQAVRYPDALITCTRFDRDVKIIPGVIVVFEVVGSSAESSRRDRIIKVREYAAVASIRRYVIVESSGIGLTVMERSSPDQAWQTTVLTNDDTLHLPEAGIEIPVSDIYEGLDFSEQDEASR